MTGPVVNSDSASAQIARAETAAIYSRCLSPQRPPNAATAWEHERLRRAARQLTRPRRQEIA